MGMLLLLLVVVGKALMGSWWGCRPILLVSPLSATARLSACGPAIKPVEWEEAYKGWVWVEAEGWMLEMRGLPIVGRATLKSELD